LARTDGRRGFGDRGVEHVLILASGDRIRHVTIRPWMTALAVCFITLFTVGYLAATAYLIFRDDLIGAAMARQARLQHDYEDRIATLRAQLDRVTSRQLVDQQLVEEKVEKLLEQQSALFSQHGKLGTLLDRAAESGLVAPPVLQPPIPARREAFLETGHQAIDSLLGAPDHPGGTASGALSYAPLRERLVDDTESLFSDVTLSLQNIEQEQMARIAELTVGAEQTATEIAAIIRKTGVDVDALVESAPGGLGGPFEEPEARSTVFDASLNGLDAALTRLEALRGTAKALPYGSPAPGQPVTSRYGNRIDPFIGRLALHAGIDFQAETGAKVLSTGAGTVVAAEYSGGYGNLVEIDHGHGITTRYGHLSRILVSAGDKLETGDLIGRAGSTGRSTGPHVHYEVRRNGRAVDPARFLSAGMKLRTYLN
jgi:Membrane proteins related to metalloendopeptidases